MSRYTITKNAIQKYAKLCGFDTVTLPIERDFLLNILLCELYKTTFSQMVVFKGGTALKKVFFAKKFDSYRFSKDLDFNIIKDVSIDSIEKLMSELIERVENEYGLRFERVGGLTKGDYGEKSVAVKIKLRDKGFVFAENVRIKFDFAIRPNFDMPYKEYIIQNHYQEYLPMEIKCLSETIESIFLGKFVALFGDSRRTESKDLFDIVSILNENLVSEKVAQQTFGIFNSRITEDRKATLQKQWDIFFKDQLPKTPDFDKYIGAYETYFGKFYTDNLSP